jgi:hypothetical protein
MLAVSPEATLRIRMWGEDRLACTFAWCKCVSGVSSVRDHEMERINGTTLDKRVSLRYDRIKVDSVS